MKHTRVSSGRGGTFFKLLVFLVLFGGVLTAAWILFLPSLLASALQKRTGFDVTITQLMLNPFTARVDLEGLVLSNPHTFPRPEFIQVASLHADAELRTLFSDHPVINYAQLDVTEVALVRNSDGTLNATLFQQRMSPTPAADTDDAKNPPAKPKDKKEEAKPEERPQTFLIKRLELKFDKLIVDDRSGRRVVPHEYAIHFSHTYENVTDAKQLVAPLAVKGLSSVGAAINGLIPGEIGRAINAVTRSGSDAMNFKEAGKKAGDTLKSFIDTLEESRKP